MWMPIFQLPKRTSTRVHLHYANVDEMLDNEQTAPEADLPDGLE